MGKTLFAAILATGFMSATAWGQVTRPSEDALKKELRDMKAYADRLEEKLRERQAKPFELPAPKLAPRDGAPPDMPNALPRFFYHFSNPRVIPSPQVPSTRPWLRPSTRPFVLPDMPRTIPPEWKRFQFNGDYVYLIPLKS